MNPVDRIPRAVITADGDPLSPRTEAMLSELVVHQTLSAPAQCELTFIGTERDALDAALRPGADLEVRIGDSDTAVFVGRATGASVAAGPGARRTWRVRGYDRMHAMRRRTEMRAHVQVTVGDLARELAAEAGLRAEVGDDGPLWPYLIQRESNLALLARVAARCGQYLAVRDDMLIVTDLAGLGAPVTLAVGDNLYEAEVDASGARACGAVEAAAWTPRDATYAHGRADDSAIGRDVSLSLARDRLDADGTCLVLDALAADDVHADGLARAALDRRDADEIVLRAVAAGNPALRPAAVVDVRRVGDDVDGRYVLTSVSHRLDGRRGYACHLSTEPPPAPTPVRGATLVPGVVVQVDDPDRRGRIRTRLPSFRDVETDWMRVMSLGAGPGKGLVLTPAIDDHVLVLLGEDDPAQGIVLGGIFADGPNDAGIVDGEAQRFVQHTAGGHRLSLDDDNGTVRVDTASGSYLEMSPDGIAVHADGDLTLEAPGNTLRLRAAAIEMENAS